MAKKIFFILLVFWISLPVRAETCADPDLGRHFIVGIPEKNIDPKTQEFLEHVCPAGIVLYQRNFESNSQLKNLINSLQQIAEKTIHQKYLIFADLEPGGATRFGIFKNVFPLGKPDWELIQRDVQLISELGITVTLSPLADFPFNPDSFINPRVRADTHLELMELNQKIISLFHQAGVKTTLKHFPGLGFFKNDPHKILPVRFIGRENWEASLKLFKSGVDQKVEFVMMAHAIYPNVDADNPAPLSEKMIKKVLRGQLGYHGFVISDDLSDMPFSGRRIKDPLDLAQATLRALKAGNDFVMFSHERSLTWQVFDLMISHGP